MTLCVHVMQLQQLADLTSNDPNTTAVVDVAQVCRRRPPACPPPTPSSPHAMPLQQLLPQPYPVVPTTLPFDHHFDAVPLLHGWGNGHRVS